MAFCNLLLSFSMMCPEFIHVVACISTSLLLSNIHYMAMSYFGFPFISWWPYRLFLLFGYHGQCCCTRSYKVLCGPLFSVILGLCLQMEVLDICGNSIFNILSSFQTICQSACTNLQCHPQCMRASISLHPCQHFCLSFFFSCSHPLGVMWYDIVVLIAFLWWLMMFSIFSHTYWPSVLLL